MTDGLKEFLIDGKLKNAYLTVKVVKQIDPSTYIIADSSQAALLDTSESQDKRKPMTNGVWYKLIKCSKENDKTVKLNRTFKPVIHKSKENIKNIELKVQEIEEFINAKSASVEYTTIDIIKSKPVNSKVNALTIKVMSVSRTINTSKGNYQICTVKDCKGVKASLNLYSKLVDSMDTFKIYMLTNLRKGEIFKNNEREMRLHTTSFTKIEEGTVEDSVNFKEVRNGQASVFGELIGIGDITTYKSCKVHYNKVNDLDECPKCAKILSQDELHSDFRLEMYIETKDQDTDELNVIQILIFKRTLDKKYSENIEESADKLVNKRVQVDYNIDDGDRCIAVSMEVCK